MPRRNLVHWQIAKVLVGRKPPDVQHTVAAILVCFPDVVCLLLRVGEQGGHDARWCVVGNDSRLTGELLLVGLGKIKKGPSDISLVGDERMLDIAWLP